MEYRLANREDLPFIVALLAHDELGRLRENYSDPLPQEYYRAFENIDRDPNQELMVITDENGQVIGTFQLSFIPYLTYQGGIRAQIEAVRVDEKYRGKGVGEQAFMWAIARAKERKAHLLQLTTDKKRPEALRFYEKLGFVATHEGMKLHFKTST
ncbi:MAG: GNAT family N-acetyltransferase [Bacteroidota bacterium]